MARSEEELAAERIGKGNKAKTKQAYYKLQREHAEESGDQATTDKIYSKLGKKSHNVDSNRGDKAILGAAPFLPEAAAGLGEMGAARLAAGAARKMIPGASREAGEAAGEAASSSRSMVPTRNTSNPPSKSVQHLGRATPVKKALPSKGRALGSSSGPPKVGSAKTSKSLAASKVREVSGATRGSQKALSTSGHSDYNAELGRMSKPPKKARAPRAKRKARV